KNRPTAATINRLIAYQYPSRTMRLLQATLYGRAEGYVADSTAHQHRILSGISVVSGPPASDSKAAALVKPQRTCIGLPHLEPYLFRSLAARPGEYDLDQPPADPPTLSLRRSQHELELTFRRRLRDVQNRCHRETGQAGIAI